MGKTRDKISGLPDSILQYILSLMPLKSAIRTSTLSSKWRDRWKKMIIYAAVLDFGEEFARDKTPEEFVGTVNSYLRLHDRKIIERFRLFFYPENQYLSDFENWIEFSIAKGVKELDLDGCHHYLPFIMIPGEPIQDKKPFKVPNCIFTSNSLTQLNLARCDFNLPLNFSGLCSLKTLYLRWVHITDEMLERTILNCPLLEKLTLRECKDLSSIKISSPDLQLKSLTLVDCYATYLEMLAPNLQSFHFNGDFCDYSLSNISSLVDAIFTAVNWDNVYDFEYDRTTLWSKFSHIKILTICRNALPFLDDFDGLEADIFQQGMPLTFHNLQELQLLLDGVGDGDLASLFTFFKECSFPCLHKTRQTLIHSNFISNYTVKGLIANWCEENNIRLNKSVESPDVSSLSLSHGNHEDIIRVDSFCSSLHSDSTSHSSFDVGNTSLRQRAIAVSSTSIEDDFNSVDHRQILTDKVTLNSKPPLEQSYSHSRSESVSSAVSSVDYVPAASAAVLTEASRVSSKCDDTSEVSGEVISACPISLPSNEDSGLSPWLSGSQIHSVNPIVLAENVNRNNNKYPPSTFSDSAYDDLTTFSHVQKLVEDLKTQSNELHTAAAAELRLLAKHNMDNRTIIAKCGAISLLVSLLYSKVKVIQENAVTALLNLSINDTNKTMIAEAGAIDPLIHVLKSGNMEARENSAATLFSLSVLEEYKIKIGRSGAVKALVDLLGFGSLRGKKDAATALFNLSIFHENKARIVQAGAVKYLVELMDPGRGMADKAIALLANLATIPEGRMAITREGGIPSLVEAVESGSQRGKENAASALFQLCFNSHKFCRLVLQEGAVPPLVALSQSGTPRAKEKAQQLLSHFRSQREGSVGKVKS